jgi:phosphoribosylformylglycinamidine synthase
LHDIAGVTDAGGRVCGLMPHPERASEPVLGTDDGMLLFRSIVESVAATAGSPR